MLTETQAADLQHTARLLAAFAGSVDGWEWDGCMAEQDPHGFGAVPCACGQVGLRFLFTWVKDGKSVITGSTCVEKVPGISGASMGRIAEALKAHEAKLRAAECASKSAEREAVIVALKAELAAKVEELVALDGAAYWREHYARVERAQLASMKSAHGKAKKMRGLLESIGRRMDNIRARAAARSPYWR